MGITFNDAVTKTVSVSGTNFVYREIGQASDVPLVFLHHRPPSWRIGTLR